MKRFYKFGIILNFLKRKFGLRYRMRKLCYGLKWWRASLLKLKHIYCSAHLTSSHWRLHLPIFLVEAGVTHEAATERVKYCNEMVIIFSTSPRARGIRAPTKDIVTAVIEQAILNLTMAPRDRAQFTGNVECRW